MVAFSLNAPIYEGCLWQPDAPGRIRATGRWEDTTGPSSSRGARDGYGKSARTYFRSVHAPPLLILPEEDGRLEFKAFDTTRSLADLENDLLLFAAVVLDETLNGRASAAERVLRLREVAVVGWRAEGVVERAEQLLEAAERCLGGRGLDPASLALFRRRLEARWVPADDTAALFLERGSVAAVLRASEGLVREDALALAEGRLMAVAS